MKIQVSCIFAVLAIAAFAVEPKPPLAPQAKKIAATYPLQWQQVMEFGDQWTEGYPQVDLRLDALQLGRGDLTIDRPLLVMSRCRLIGYPGRRLQGIAPGKSFPKGKALVEFLGPKGSTGGSNSNFGNEARNVTLHCQSVSSGFILRGAQPSEHNNLVADRPIKGGFAFKFVDKTIATAANNLDANFHHGNDNRQSVGFWFEKNTDGWCSNLNVYGADTGYLIEGTNGLIINGRAEACGNPISFTGFSGGNTLNINVVANVFKGNPSGFDGKVIVDFRKGGFGNVVNLRLSRAPKDAGWYDRRGVWREFRRRGNGDGEISSWMEKQVTGHAGHMFRIMDGALSVDQVYLKQQLDELAARVKELEGKENEQDD